MTTFPHFPDVQRDYIVSNRQKCIGSMPLTVMVNPRKIKFWITSLSRGPTWLGSTRKSHRVRPQEMSRLWVSKNVEEQLNEIRQFTVKSPGSIGNNYIYKSNSRSLILRSLEYYSELFGCHHKSGVAQMFFKIHNARVLRFSLIWSTPWRPWSNRHLYCPIEHNI